MRIGGLLTFRISIFESLLVSRDKMRCFCIKPLVTRVSNIKVMPAKHTSFPNGPRVYGLTSGRIRLTHELVLDSDYLKSFGELLVPEPIWRAFTRFSVWIEPALVAE